MADELDPVTGLPKVPAGDPSNPEGTPKEPEPQVPLSRLREVSDKVKNLEEELAKFKSASPKTSGNFGKSEIRGKRARGARGKTTTDGIGRTPYCPRRV